MYDGNLLGIGFARAPGGGTLRNVPISAMAEAPGMFRATMRALTLAIPCARAARHPDSPPTTAIPAVNAIRPSAVGLPNCLMKFLPWVIRNARRH
jgi:hypothetical protein